MLLKGEHITKHWNDKVVLDDVSFIVESGDCIGIVGKNGAGKTTLAEIISKQLVCEKGVIIEGRSNLSIGYLRQTSIVDERLDSASNEMQSFLQIVSQLHVPKYVGGDDQSRYLSGGEKTKVALATLWAKQYDLMILDEPTNNMDQQGITWLIQQIKKNECAYIIISHDRFFLDQVTHKIFEIEHGKLNLFYGNYTTYKREKQKQQASLMHQYVKEVKEQKKIDAQIQNLRQWSDKAHKEAGKQGTLSERRQAGLKEFQRVKAKKMDKQIKSREKRLLKLKNDQIEKPRKDNDIALRGVKGGTKQGKRVTGAYEITKSYGENILFEKSSFYINRGEKIGIIGDNGSGKTTLLRLLQGYEAADYGKIKVIEGVEYVTQDVMQLDESITILQMLAEFDATFVARARNEFALFGFQERMLYQPIATLSLGERMRFKILIAILQQTPVLILDEPTNHLDVKSREELEKLLQVYTGTLLLVSHDRALIDSVCNCLLRIENKRIHRFEYTLSEYEGRQQEKSLDRMSENLLADFRKTALLSRLALCDVNSKEYQAIESELNTLKQ